MDLAVTLPSHPPPAKPVLWNSVTAIDGVGGVAYDAARAKRWSEAEAREG